MIRGISCGRPCSDWARMRTTCSIVWNMWGNVVTLRVLPCQNKTFTYSLQGYMCKAPTLSCLDLLLRSNSVFLLCFVLFLLFTSRFAYSFPGLTGPVPVPFGFSLFASVHYAFVCNARQAVKDRAFNAFQSSARSHGVLFWFCLFSLHCRCLPVRLR